jgi:hypothetical protein
MFATTVFLQIAEYKELRIGPEKRSYRNLAYTQVLAATHEGEDASK